MIDCRHTPRRLTAAALLLAGLLCAGVGLADDELPADLQAAEQDIEDLEEQKQDILQQVDELATLIAGLQARGELSRAEHENLERYLLRAQSVQEQLRAVEAQAGDAREGRDHLLGALIVEAQREIDLALEQLEGADRNDELAARLHRLIEKKKAWQAMRQPAFDETAAAFSVEADPTDSPRQLRIKGDILADQADAIRLDMVQMEGRIESLQEEKQLRQKVQELTSEMALFDESEELLSRATVLGDRGSFDEGGIDTGTNPEDPVATLPLPTADFQGLALLPAIAEAMNDPVPRSPEAIQAWIERLISHRDGLRSRADSLQERSTWFHDRAGGSGEESAE